MSERNPDTRELGRLRPPFPSPHCANITCPNERWTDELERFGAYLYRDLDTDKLVTFCGDCARYVELNAAHRFKLIAL